MVALELTDGKGVDQLLDVVGGVELNQSVAATRVGGHISQIGFLRGQTAQLDLKRVIFRQTAIPGIAVGPSRAFVLMNDFLNKHEIHPMIDKVYAFDQARAAYEHLARGAFGKVVIKVGGQKSSSLAVTGSSVITFHFAVERAYQHLNSGLKSSCGRSLMCNGVLFANSGRALNVHHSSALGD